MLIYRNTFPMLKKKKLMQFAGINASNNTRSQWTKQWNKLNHKKNSKMNKSSMK